MDQIRTDLALESQETMQMGQVDAKGVRFIEKRLRDNIIVSTVVIETENGAKTMGKPRGTYVTIEAEGLDSEEEHIRREVAVLLAKVLRKLTKVRKEEIEVLVVGLGNRNVTPDSLGPLVADHLLVTRHMLNEYGSYAFGKKKMNRISSIVPGVMAQTGMECAEIIGGIVRQTKPDLVVAVDALAARSVKRLNRTIQVTDTGIIPGSGVGNHRHGLNEKSMGVPVLSVGIPTVIDAATIVRDAVQHVMAMTDDPAGRLLAERVTPGLQAMFVTSKDIDESVRKLSSILADGLNIAYGGVHTKSASGIS